MTVDHQAAQTRRALAEEVAALVAAAKDAVVGATLDGTVTIWNQGAERLYGYTAAEMIGRKISALAPPGSEDNVERLRACVEHGRPGDYYETKRRTKSGEVISVSVNLTPIHDETGAVLGLSMVTRDESERPQSRETLRILLECELADDPDLLAQVRNKLGRRAGPG